MFDELLRQLKNLEGGMTIRVPISADEKGYIDRQCPSEECRFPFKVQDDDWTNLSEDSAAYCPRCRHEAPAESWLTEDQHKHLEREAIQQMEAKLHEALRRGTQDFNRHAPRGGFITMSMSVSGPTPRSFVLPTSARAALEQELSCEECRARFAVLGSAYFCPCCGRSSVERTFDDSLRKVLAKLDNLDRVRQAFDDAGLHDEAENTCRSLIESSLPDCVVAFQYLCEALYGRVPGAQCPRRNAFQNLDQGSQLWTDAVGLGYDSVLAPEDLARLRTVFQKRHLLLHADGIVDADYLRKSADTTYVLGQRIVVSAEEAKTAVRLVRGLADALRARVP